MEIEEFKKLLETYDGAFVQFQGETDMTDGWKLSIQGRTIEDALYLYEHLYLLLGITKVYFKFATQQLIKLEHPQQSHKLLTIYIPNGVDAKSYAELVSINLPDYKGWYGIKPLGYEEYKKGIFFRNDRTEDGKYVMPYTKEELKK